VDLWHRSLSASAFSRRDVAFCSNT
jgi:hypothetical protein